jgi:hypothetical protein
MKRRAAPLLVLIPIVLFQLFCERSDLYDTAEDAYYETLSPGPVPGNGGVIIASNIQAYSIDLSWTKATDDETPQGDLEYKVFYSLSGNIDTVANAEANGTQITSTWTRDLDSITASGLYQNTTYFFNVIVRDSSGFVVSYRMMSAITLYLAYLPSIDPTATSGDILAKTIPAHAVIRLSILPLPLPLRVRRCFPFSEPAPPPRGYRVQPLSHPQAYRCSPISLHV